MIELSRKDLNYLPYDVENLRESGAGVIEGSKLSMSDIEDYYGWHVELVNSECHIERKGKNMIITHPNTGLKFRLKETSKISYIF